VAHTYVHARVWIVSLVILAVLVSGCASRPLRLGETREEYGAERACGARSKSIEHGHVSPLAFERRMGGAHATAVELACAAQAAVAPEALPLAEPIAAERASGARCEAEAQCYDGFRVSGDAEADLAGLADRCGRACGMTAHTKVVTSEAAEGEAPQVYAIELDAATCYRFFTVGAPEIDVLAAAVTDREGNVVAIDNSRDRAPILGPRASFCPSTGGRYRLVIAAVYGGGSYVLQVWSRPRTPDDR